jgi:hypothetical protein
VRGNQPKGLLELQRLWKGVEVSAREAVTPAEVAIEDVVNEALNDLDEADLEYLAKSWGVHVDRITEAWEDAEITVTWSTPIRRA